MDCSGELLRKEGLDVFASAVHMQAGQGDADMNGFLSIIITLKIA